jgi:hypothetical protein
MGVNDPGNFCPSSGIVVDQYLRELHEILFVADLLWSRSRPMKLGWIVVACAIAISMPISASAQGVIGGAQQGASQGARQGSKAAGPVGGAVGGVVGGTVGGVTGGVKGALGVPSKPKGKSKTRTQN